MADEQRTPVDSQLEFANPVTAYPQLDPDPQHQPNPGLDARLEPKPDRGERTYRGLGRLPGRRALITGGDSGIGAAVAIAFAREGADVAIAYLPDEEEDAQTVAGLIRAEGRTAVLLPGDLLDASYRDGLVTAAEEGLGGLDVLVNNAGMQFWSESIQDLTDDQVDRSFALNVQAMFTLSRAALRVMPAGSTIINTASVQAYKPSDVLPDYAATKAAIKAFTKALAQQAAPRGIRVNAVAPGPFWTPLQVTDGQPDAKLDGFGQQSWLGRAGHPVEIAPAYVYLASAESSYVVGSVLDVNGGAPTP